MINFVDVLANAKNGVSITRGDDTFYLNVSFSDSDIGNFFTNFDSKEKGDIFTSVVSSIVNAIGIWKGYDNIYQLVKLADMEYIKDKLRDFGFAKVDGVNNELLARVYSSVLYDGKYITDSDINEFIEQMVINTSEEKIPLEMLKAIKAKMVEDNVLGYLGTTIGAMMRSFTDKNVTMLEEIVPEEYQSEDILSQLKSQYEIISKEAKEAGQEIKFIDFYNKNMITHFDSLQRYITHSEMATTGEDGFDFILDHDSFPLETPSNIAKVTHTYNIWRKKFSASKKVNNISIIRINDTLYPKIHCPIFNISNGNLPFEFINTWKAFFIILNAITGFAIDSIVFDVDILIENTSVNNNLTALNDTIVEIKEIEIETMDEIVDISMDKFLIDIE